MKNLNKGKALTGDEIKNESLLFYWLFHNFVKIMELDFIWQGGLC